MRILIPLPACFHSVYLNTQQMMAKVHISAVGHLDWLWGPFSNSVQRYKINFGECIGWIKGRTRPGLFYIIPDQFLPVFSLTSCFFQHILQRWWNICLIESKKVNTLLSAKVKFAKHSIAINNVYLIEKNFTMKIELPFLCRTGLL